MSELEVLEARRNTLTKALIALPEWKLRRIAKQDYMEFMAYVQFKEYDGRIKATKEYAERQEICKEIKMLKEAQAEE